MPPPSEDAPTGTSVAAERSAGLTGSDGRSAGPAWTAAGGPPHHRHWHPPDAHEILLDPEHDRWAWRRRIRRNPGRLAVYRVAVGLAGLLLILTGLATGWLPGPGGIPLILLGLAVWSSEFQWANRLMQRFKAQLRRYQRWSRARQVAFWVAFFLGCGALGYGYMLLLGVPGWLPNPVEYGLLRLPGI